MDFYIDNDLEKYKNKIKKATILLIATAFVTVVITVLLSTLAVKENHLLIQLANTAITAAFCFLVIYKVDTVILNSRKIIKHYQYITNAPKTEFVGVISSIGGVITDSSSLRVREINLTFDRRNYCFYLLEDFSFDFAVGDEIKLVIAKRYIVSSLIMKKSEKESYE